MLEAYHRRHPKPKTIVELKETLQMIWDSLPQGPIDKAVKEFPKWSKACVEAEGGHFEHSQSLHNSDACWVVLMSLFYCVFAGTFLNVLKLLHGNAAVLIILRVLSTIKYW